MKYCATAGAVPGLGEPGGPTPSSPLPFTHIHMVTDAWSCACTAARLATVPHSLARHVHLWPLPCTSSLHSISLSRGITSTPQSHAHSHTLYTVTYVLPPSHTCTQQRCHVLLYQDCTCTSWGASFLHFQPSFLHFPSPGTITFSSLLQMRNLRGGSWPHHPVGWGMLWARAQLPEGSGLLLPIPGPVPWSRLPLKAPG